MLSFTASFCYEFSRCFVKSAEKHEEFMNKMTKVCSILFNPFFCNSPLEKKWFETRLKSSDIEQKLKWPFRSGNVPLGSFYSANKTVYSTWLSNAFFDVAAVKITRKVERPHILSVHSGICVLLLRVKWGNLRRHSNVAIQRCMKNKSIFIF